MILLQYYKVKLLPFLHTTSYRHSAFIDIDNQFGFGPNALVSWGGPDRTQCHIVGRSILEFLEQHLERLNSRYYFDKKGRIEWFPSDPRREHGSITVTKGVKIEASAKYIHYFSTFDRAHYHQTRFYFVYQIRISAAAQK
jgi:hypothetical protein